MTLKQRLAGVERTIEERQELVSWPEGAAAMARIQARVRMKLARLIPKCLVQTRPSVPLYGNQVRTRGQMATT